MLALEQFQIRKLEAQHAAGYERHPVAAGEFDGWEDEQEWGDRQKSGLGPLIASLSRLRLEEVDRAIAFALGMGG